MESLVVGIVVSFFTLLMIGTSVGAGVLFAKLEEDPTVFLMLLAPLIFLLLICTIIYDFGVEDGNQEVYQEAQINGVVVPKIIKNEDKPGYSTEWEWKHE